jgi:hypothetical protein
VPWWEQKADLTGGNRQSLGSPLSGPEFEALDIYRNLDTPGSDIMNAWNGELNTFGRADNVTQLTVTSGPRPQQAAGFNGVIGQYHYIQSGNGVQIDGTLWVGQVNGDRVVMNFRCDPREDARLDAAVAQVLATIDFNAA